MTYPVTTNPPNIPGGRGGLVTYPLPPVNTSVASNTNCYMVPGNSIRVPVQSQSQTRISGQGICPGKFGGGQAQGQSIQSTSTSTDFSYNIQGLAQGQQPGYAQQQSQPDQYVGSGQQQHQQSIAYPMQQRISGQGQLQQYSVHQQQGYS